MDPRLEEAFRRARSGDPRAFRTITEQLGPELVRFLTCFLGGDVHAAHDVVQETLVRAWAARATITSARHLRRWCYRVARCKAVSWIRRRVPPGKRVTSLDLITDDGHRLFDPAGPAEARPEGDDRAAALRRALLRLPDRYAGPVHLFYVQGYGTKETAELLGIQRAAVKTQLHRARKILRREIHRDAERRGRTTPSAPEGPS